MTEQIAQMVDAICAGDDDPLLRQQAVMIAESQLWLSCVKAEKVAAIELLRDPTASALTNNACSVRARARIHLLDVAYHQLKKDKTKAAGRDPEREPISRMLEVARPPPWVKEIPEDAERDEYEAMREGLRDLMRLLRYEQRAWSRRCLRIHGDQIDEAVIRRTANAMTDANRLTIRLGSPMVSSTNR